MAWSLGMTGEGGGYVLWVHILCSAPQEMVGTGIMAIWLLCFHYIVTSFWQFSGSGCSQLLIKKDKIWPAIKWFVYILFIMFHNSFIKGTVQQDFDPPNFSSLESIPGPLTNWVKIFLILVKISPSYLNFKFQRTDSPGYQTPRGDCHNDLALFVVLRCTVRKVL